MASFSGSGKEDYDPVKAHEYYEKHKRLKGRRSTKGFSQQQKEQFAYAKDQLRQQYKEDVSDISEGLRETKAQLAETAKAQIQTIREAMKARMKNMSPEEKQVLKTQLGAAIEKIRTDTAIDKMKATDTAAKDKETAKKDYEAALDKSHSDIKG